jgi:hypothetical protein
MGLLDILKIKTKSESNKKPILLPCENCLQLFPYEQLMEHESDCAYITQPSEFFQIKIFHCSQTYYIIGNNFKILSQKRDT